MKTMWNNTILPVVETRRFWGTFTHPFYSLLHTLARKRPLLSQGPASGLSFAKNTSDKNTRKQFSSSIELRPHLISLLLPSTSSKDACSRMIVRLIFHQTYQTQMDGSLTQSVFLCYATTDRSVVGGIHNWCIWEMRRELCLSGSIGWIGSMGDAINDDPYKDEWLRGWTSAVPHPCRPDPPAHFPDAPIIASGQLQTYNTGRFDFTSIFTSYYSCYHIDKISRKKQRLPSMKDAILNNDKFDLLQYLWWG